jgi:hypothetical protein
VAQFAGKNRNENLNGEFFDLIYSIIEVLKKMYTDINIKLSIEDAELIFKSISGVKQGDNLAPVLFLFVVQAAVETMHKKWSSNQIQTPDLKYFPSESDVFLNKR